MHVTERTNRTTPGARTPKRARLSTRVQTRLLNDVSMPAYAQMGVGSAGAQRSVRRSGTTIERRPPRHKTKCRMPGIWLALRMYWELSEENRADTQRRRCATRQKGSRRWSEQGRTAHTGRPTQSVRVRRCAAQGSP